MQEEPDRTDLRCRRTYPPQQWQQISETFSRLFCRDLRATSIDYGTPFFVKYGRVAVEDEISEITGADVVCTLIGERPGLITATSMSAYIAYKATVGMPEARRTVLSNIHSAGTVPAEAGAHIAEIIKIMLERKVSGTELKL